MASSFLLCCTIVIYWQFKLTSTTQQITLSHDTIPTSIERSWSPSVQQFMSLFSKCKIQIVVARELESDEMLELAEYFVSKLEAAVLVYTIFDYKGNQRPYKTEYIPTSFRKDYLEYWNHTNCYVQVFTSQLLNRPSRFDNWTLLRRFANILSNLNDNPDFIILLLTGMKFEDGREAYRSLLPTDQAKLLEISVSSVYIGIRNGQSIDALSLPCLQSTWHYSYCSEQPYESISGLVKTQGLRQLWESLNSNLGGGYIIWKMSLNSAKTCDPRFDRQDITPFTCTIQLMQQMANFSVISMRHFEDIASKTNFAFLGQLKTTVYSEPGLFLTLREHKNIDVWDWCAVGGKILNIYILAIIDVNDMNMAAFWQLIDLPLLLCTVITAMGLSMTILLLQRNPGFKPLLQFLPIVLGFLIDRSSPPRQVLRKCTNLKAATLIFLWAQAAMLISGSYRGALFSHLTSLPTPSVPQTMDEIATSASDVWSNSYYYLGDTGQKFSLLHGCITDFLSQTNGSDNLGVATVRNSASKFASKLLWVNAETTDIAYSQTKNGPAIMLHDANLTRPYRLSTNQIYIHWGYYTSLYSLLLNQLGHKVMIVRGPEIPLLVQYIPMQVYRNFFAVHYKRMLFQAVESGIWARWERSENVFKFLKELDDFNERLSNGTSSSKQMSLTKGNKMAALFLDYELALQQENRTKFAPLQVSVLHTIFTLWWILILASFGRFLAEILTRKYFVNI